MVFIGGGTGKAPETAEEVGKLLVSATLWTPGEKPREWDLSTELPGGGVLWIDVESSASADDLLARLEPLCPRLEREMLDDLLCPDETPEGRSWHSGTVRLASSFAVYAPEARENGGLTPVYTPSAEAVYEAVELLAGDGWLITRWHDACRYCGSDLIEDGLPPVSREALRASVEKNWATRDRGIAGDLGVMVMYELTLTYAHTHRRFLTALEDWELTLYKSDDHKLLEISPEQETRLHDLWGARARLCKWLNPLNPPGLRDDLDKAWLPATDHDAVIKVDKRVDKALGALSQLGDVLRSSFQLVYVTKAEAKRERNERLQRNLGFLAACFLVPTLVVGFYGANTWLPGEHRQWGFLEMLVVMLIATIGILLLLRWMLDAHSSSSSISSTTRRSISPRVARTSSGGRPLGSSSSQSR
jgi:hypothetical protein